MIPIYWNRSVAKAGIVYISVACFPLLNPFQISSPPIKQTNQILPHLHTVRQRRLNELHGDFV